MLSSYAQAWDSSFLLEEFPPSYCIVEDIDRVAYIKMFQVKEVVIPHLGTRRGQIYDHGLNQLP